MTKKQIWLIAGTVTAALAVLCCAAMVVGAIWLWRDNPEDVVENYLAAVQAGEDSEAREHLCDAWRGTTLGNIVNLSAWADVVDYDVMGSEVHDESATVDARVTYRVLGVTDSGELRFTLVSEDDGWKVCGIRNR